MIIKDLKEYIDDREKDIVGLKALRIYNRCMRSGKVQLAYKIENKYKRYFPKSDLAISFGMALMAASKYNKT